MRAASAPGIVENASTLLAIDVKLFAEFGKTPGVVGSFTASGELARSGHAWQARCSTCWREIERLVRNFRFAWGWSRRSTSSQRTLSESPLLTAWRIQRMALDTWSDEGVELPLFAGWGALPRR